MTAEELLDKIMHGEIVTVQGKTLLTGSQWYDRWNQELDKVTDGFPELMDEVRKLYEPTRKEALAYKLAKRLDEAARKAAGL